ncbi:MAG: hypothetical protein K6U74_14250, partial [Firmicutes bacterium]|nr:hypothetical protein [Bacillota bacterium]
MSMLEKSKINNKAFLLICIILLQAMLVTFMVWHMHLWMNEISLFPLMPVKNAMVFFIVSGFLLTVIALM